MKSVVLILFRMLIFLCNAYALERIKYNNPGLVVDLGVGLWAWPILMDYDQDGDYDLLVSCPDKPYNGIYFFENSDGLQKMPVFKPGVKICQAYKNIQPSYIGDKTRLLIPFINFIEAFNVKKITELAESLNITNIHGFILLKDVLGWLVIVLITLSAIFVWKRFESKKKRQPICLSPRFCF